MEALIVILGGFLLYYIGVQNRKHNKFYKDNKDVKNTRYRR